MRLLLALELKLMPELHMMRPLLVLELMSDPRSLQTSQK
jgi:hypothetical protein